ncbi:BQ5605_C007g04810 [Microbotryum silenes-dioicae]|uniref:BQ5605_C007g04810 protein n=1 Tax=Microbotryum silenes-dioicae TaxID=796604 RepID=A0A2X0M828_9BASI|nr:BQ5605_C007g04810 [Microbotryum silenes-dioicae]
MRSFFTSSSAGLFEQRLCCLGGRPSVTRRGARPEGSIGFKAMDQIYFSKTEASALGLGLRTGAGPRLTIFDLLLTPELLTARQKALLKQDAKAQSLILNHLDSDNAVTARACTTAHEMWNSLHNNHVGLISDQVRFLTAQLHDLSNSRKEKRS